MELLNLKMEVKILMAESVVVTLFLIGVVLGIAGLKYIGWLIAGRGTHPCSKSVEIVFGVIVGVILAVVALGAFGFICLLFCI